MARHGDQGDHFLFPGGDEALVENLERAIVLDRHQGPMKRALRTPARPPPMKLLPLHWPDWRVHGARPASAAIWRRLSAPSSNPHVQLVPGDVDSDNVHPIPSLRKRARLAAQATVRVRWNGGRRPSLLHGLVVPRWPRSFVRHRDRPSIASGLKQVTRWRGIPPNEGRGNLPACQPSPRR